MPVITDILEKKRALDAARPFAAGAVRSIADWYERELTVAALLVEKAGLTRDDVLAVLARRKPLRTLPMSAQKLALNHLQALELMSRLAYEQIGHTTERTICAFHGVLFDGLDDAPGQYRDGAPDDADADDAPDPAKLRVSMSALSSWLRRSDGGLEAALEAHIRLMRIRPFHQGNAAVALLTTNLTLNRVGFPPIVVNEETLEEYEQAIKRAKTADDRTGFRQLAASLLDRSLDLCLAGAGRRSATAKLRAAPGPFDDDDYLA